MSDLKSENTTFAAIKPNMKYVFLYLIMINYIAFSMFHLDKKRARKNMRRISEKNLLTLCAFGGTFGAWLAMKNFNHKTSKTSFKIPFYIIVVIQAVILFFVFRR